MRAVPRLKHDFLHPQARKQPFVYRRSTRLLDVGISSIAVLVLAPPLCVLGFVLRLSTGGFFVAETRCGLHGKPFVLIRFRVANSDTQQLTRLGAWAKWASLDNL